MPSEKTLGPRKGPQIFEAAPKGSEVATVAESYRYEFGARKGPKLMRPPRWGAESRLRPHSSFLRICVAFSGTEIRKNAGGLGDIGTKVPKPWDPER